MATLQEKQISPNDLTHQLIRHTKSFLEDAEDLIYFLPNWISYRSDTLESLENARPSTGPLSCVNPAASSIGSALVNKLAHVDHRVAAAASTIGHIMSFGFTCGASKAKQEFNNRRLNVVASRLREDLSNTNDLESIIAHVMESLDALLKDFQACSDLQADHRDSNQMIREVRSILRSPSSGGFVQYQDLIGWSDQVMKLLQQFMAILRQSREPNQQVGDLLRRNPTPNVVVAEGEFDGWVRNLRDGYHAIENARNAARQNAITVNNLLSRMLTASGSSTAVSATQPPPQGSNSTSNGFGERFPNRGDNTYDAYGENTSEIDRWFDEVRRLINNSIDVAQEVSRLFSEEHIPLRRGSETQQNNNE